MGTSSPRQGPTNRLWRLAKGTATRYLSPENTGVVAAREVAASYLAALGEGGGPGLAGALAAFRLTRKAAQNLGAFWCQVDFQGVPAALSAWGLADWSEEAPASLAQPLSAALGVAGGGLEQAVAHTALVGVLLKLPAGLSAAPPADAPLVRRFLAEAFHLRLALDLGESLEAVAPGYSRLRQGLSDLAACIALAAEAPLPAAAPRTPDHWLGLPGWTWVTGVLAGLISELSR